STNIREASRSRRAVCPGSSSGTECILGDPGGPTLFTLGNAMIRLAWVLVVAAGAFGCSNPAPAPPPAAPTPSPPPAASSPAAAGGTDPGGGGTLTEAATAAPPASARPSADGLPPPKPTTIPLAKTGDASLDATLAAADKAFEAGDLTAALAGYEAAKKAAP